MRRCVAIFFSFLAAAFATPGCNGAKDKHSCADNDGDGYSAGDEFRCGPIDCNDFDPDCHEGSCCPYCQDNDHDFYGEGNACRGPDCDDFDPECHNDEDPCCEPLGICLDTDGDGLGFVACPGVDCNESDNSCSDPRDGCCITGAMPCGLGLECIIQCTEPNCYSDCLRNMDPEAQILYDNLQTCAAFAGCAADPGLSFWECASEQCRVNMDNCEADQPGP